MKELFDVIDVISVPCKSLQQFAIYKLKYFNVESLNLNNSLNCFQMIGHDALPVHWKENCDAKATGEG